MDPIYPTVPKLLPIAGTWAAPFALFSAYLSMSVVAERQKTLKFIGDKPDSTTAEPCKLEIYSRCHKNFLENVPSAFVFLAIAELNGGNRKALNYAMGILLVLRIAHVELGLKMKGKWGDGGVGRPIGYLGTNAVLLGLSGYATWLVKGFWGL